MEERGSAVRQLAEALSRVIRAAAMALAATVALVVVDIPRSAAQASCPTPPGFEPRGHASADGAAVAFRTVPATIVLGLHFTVEAIVCGAGAPPLLTRVDATMPEHRHGMNYRPTLAAKAPGHYVADGFLFHMPGRWQIQFDVDAGGRRTRLTSDVNVE